LVKQDETLVEKGISYVIEKGNPDFIANFVNRTNQANTHTFFRLWYGRSSAEIIEQVLDKADFPQKALLNLAEIYEGGSRTETFVVVLSKIVRPEDQEELVEQGIKRLATWPSGTSPLLNALKGKTFRSERLEDLTIQKAFMEGVKVSKVERLPKNICNHALITPELYADALIVTAKWWEKYRRMRDFLLKQADQYDLQVVKERPGYADLDAGFRSAIEEALETAAPGGTRTRAYDIQSAEKTKKEFMEVEHAVAISDIANIIASYLTGEEPKRVEPQQGKAVVQKKKVEAEEEEQVEVGEGEWETMEEVD